MTASLKLFSSLTISSVKFNFYTLHITFSLLQNN